MSLQPTLGAEHKTLLTYLNAQRNHALGILEGLDQQVLRQPALPSGWTCEGLIHHLAIDVERFWFRAVVAGQQAAIDKLTGAGNSWQADPDMPTSVVLDLYRQEITLSNAIIAATPLDTAPAWWPLELFGEWRLHTVREIVLHVITETACHAGHLDAARELLDGRLWFIQPG